jgi:hypothetical protein
MSTAAIDIFNSNGEASTYLKVSARLPKFLETYSPEKGYCLVSEVTDLLNIQKGKLDLLKAQSHHKENIDAAGKNVTLIFTRKLISPKGNVLATASALKEITAYKDYETGETAALQRLLALLGYGGECFDEDEVKDMQDQSLGYADHTSTRAEPKAEETPAKVQTHSSKEVTPIKKEVTERKKSPDAIPTALKRQLQHMAKVKGATTNPCSTKAEAKAELKRLSNL